ncbi:MAG: porin [Vicinamibacterales bacterium]
MLIVVFGLVLGRPAPTEAANEALLKLLQVLRDRGAITPAEYDEMRKVAEAETPAPDARLAAIEEKVAAAQKGAGDAVARTLANKWYERIGLRGYSQLRYAEVLRHDGPPIEVFADRSVNENETFVLRRGRFVFSGNATSRLALYAQMDFNGSTGTGDFALQMRDLYADLALDREKAWRLRFGQSKVPFGFVNLQSSQNRAALERPSAMNTAVEGERDLGAALMWASPEARRRFADLTGLGLKGSGDYGVVAVGVYSGQGLNRSDQNGDPHVFARVSYPFKLQSGQFVELGVQGYHGRFVTPTQALTVNGTTLTPSERADGVLDERMAFTAVWYPQPFGVEAEWTIGRGPSLSDDSRTIEVDALHGGYVQLGYLARSSRIGSWFPFFRWDYYDGARKFARNAPHLRVHDLDFGLEFARWAEFEVTAMYSHTLRRSRTSAPFGEVRSGDRLGVQVQWNY